MKQTFLKNLLRLGAAIFLLSFLFSCEEPDIVGLEVQPPNDKMDVVFDTITLVAYSVKEDSIRTDETVYNLLGSNEDPVFGKNSASFYSQFRLSSDNVNFGTNLHPDLDSIILSLAYKGIYGDTSAQQTVKVYELAENIYKDSVYYSNREILTTGVSLASKTFVPNLKDSVIVGGEKQAPQLRIRLSDELGQRFLDASGSTSLSDNTNFLEFFKGIYVTNLPAIGTGAIMYFDMLNSLSKITLYYHNDTTDSLKYNFVSNELCARINHFNHSKYQYADSYLLSEISGDTTKGDSILYLQSMAGLKIRIQYPYIRDLIKNGRIAINKADLIVSVDDNPVYGNLSTYSPPAQLVLIEEQNGLIRFLLDQYEGMSYYGGAYNSSKKEYKFNIARHIQQVVDGPEHNGKENLGLYLVVWLADRPNKANRVVLNGTKRHSGNLRLQITYTKLY